MNVYSYRIYRNALNNPIVGGTIQAANMEDAGNKIIATNKVEAVHEERLGLMYHYFMYNGQKVGLLIYLNPEEY